MKISKTKLSITTKATALFFLIALVLTLAGCGQKNNLPLIVCTTSQVGDIITNIVQNTVRLKVMFGPGIDPHTFYPKPSDTKLLKKANIIFFNGLNLEDKLAFLLEKNLNHKSYSASNPIDKEKLIVVSENNQNKIYDPHIWFDIDIWKEASVYFTEILMKKLPQNRELYERNLAKYLDILEKCKQQARLKIDQTTNKNRILLTTHDAFSYFARFNDLETKSLLGITTYSEVSIKTISEIQKFILDKDIKVVFAEHGVRDKGLILLKKSLATKGKKITISEQKLYSDAMGENYPVNTYTGMYQYNIDTLVNEWNNL